MTFTYDISALTVELNTIRFYIGDTDSTDPLLEDEEIAYIQANYSTLLIRVAECCRMICSKVARKVDYRLSLLSEKASAIYDRYKALAERFEAQTSLSYPWAGSIIESLKEDAEDDTSLVHPKIKKGIHDNDR